MFKRVTIFDLDMTIVDSSHRTPNKPDGTLDLFGYFERKTRQHIFSDRLLPLAVVMRDLFYSGETYVVICTARDMNDDDFDFLNAKEIPYHKILNRNLVRDATEITCPVQLFQYISEGKIKTKPYYMKSDHLYKAHVLSYLDQLKQFKNLPKFFWDDARPVISHFRKHPNYTMMNAVTYNQRLAA